MNQLMGHKFLGDLANEYYIPVSNRPVRGQRIDV